MLFSDQDNHLIKLARTARWTPNLLLALPLTLAFLFGALILGAVISQVALSSLGESPLHAEIGRELRNIISFGLVVLALAAWLRFVELRLLWTTGLTRTAKLRPILIGWSFSIGLIAVALGLVILAGGGSVGFSQSPLGGLTAVLLLVVILPSRFVQAGAEELVFRGWLLPVLAVRHGTPIAVLLSSLVFSFVHVANSGFLPLATLNIALLGVFMALYALREGSLWGVIALHAGLNWAQANLFGLSASGHSVEATLLQVQLTGPDLVTGGQFGIENSLVMTGVALSAVMFELVVRRSTASLNGVPASAPQKLSQPPQHG